MSPGPKPKLSTFRPKVQIPLGLSFSMRRSFFVTTSQRPSSAVHLLSPPSAAPARQRHATIRDTPQTHQSKASTNPNSVYYLKCISSLINTISKNPRDYNALNTLDSLLKQTHFFSSAVSLIFIDFLSQINKLQRAKTVLLSLKSKGKVSDFFLYGLVFDFLVKDGKISDVETVWNEICNDSEVKIDISGYVIHVCKFGAADEVKSVCESVLVGGRVLKKESYVALIGALCRVNEGILAKTIVKEMILNGYTVDDLSYFVMFQRFCRNGDVDEADITLRKLVERKFPMDVCVYGNFMYALCKSGKFREANKLFRKLIKEDSMEGLKSAPVLKEGRRKIFQLNCQGSIPKVMVYEAYFRSLCNIGRLDEAEMLLKNMMKMRTVPEICVYGSFIKALFRVGRAEDAIKFFNAVRRKGIVKLEDIASFVIKGLCEHGKSDDALKLFRDVKSSGAFCCTDVCNCILDGYWKEGRVSEAASFFERLQDGSFGVPDLSTYMIMSQGYYAEGNISMAQHIFEEMPSRMPLVNGKLCHFLYGRLYDVIVRGLCASGRLEEALKYLNEMIEHQHLVFGKRWRSLLYSEINTDGASSHDY